MDDNVILHVGTAKFLLSHDEAMVICTTLNSSSRIENAWIKDVASEQSHVIKSPGFTSWVTPMTAIFQMELDSNMKALAEKNK